MSLMEKKYELPEALKRSSTDPGADPAVNEARAMAMLAEVSPLIVACVSSDLRTWLSNRSIEVASAWLGEISPDVAAALEAASGEATMRVAKEIEDLLNQDPQAQRSTPQSILRGCHLEPGQVLARLGVPEVERGAFEDRSLPGDKWSLSPNDLGEISQELGPLLLAWGLGKATVLRARAAT